MIRLRPRPPVPNALMSEKVEKLKRELAEKVNAGAKLKKGDFKSYIWLKDDVRESLYKHHKGKCCYCERKRELKRESDVEHYRPKAAIEGEGHPGYWWLAYEWSNYLYACKPCNQEHKGARFPLMDGGIRAKGPKDSLEDEKPFLINPIDENPEDYISFEWQRSADRYVQAIGLDQDSGERGKKTIELTGLNRISLMEERAGLLTLQRKLGLKG